MTGRSNTRIACVKGLILVAGKLSTTVAFWRPWPLHFTSSFLGIDAFAGLSYRATLALPYGLANSTDGEVVMLRTNRAIDCSILIQDKLTSVIKLFIERLIMVIYVCLRQVIQESVVSVSRISSSVAVSEISTCCELSLVLLVLGLDWFFFAFYRAAGDVCVFTCWFRSIWELLAISRFHERLRTHAPLATIALRILGFEWTLAFVWNHSLVNINRLWIFTHVIIGYFGSLSSINRV